MRALHHPVTPALITLVLLLGTGCGDLLDSTILIDTDEQTITLDTASLGLTVPSGSTIPKVPCAKDADCTIAGVGLKCGGGSYACSLKCQSQACAVVATAEQSTQVDLTQKLKSAGVTSVLSKVTVYKVTYAASENSLTFATPQLELLVAPDGAKSTKEQSVTLFATMPAIAKQSTPSGELVLSDAGSAALANYVYNAYKYPFLFFGRAQLVFKSGDPLPKGRLVLRIKAIFKIEPF